MCDILTTVSLIQQYADKHLALSSEPPDSRGFRIRSYQRWAAFELIFRIMDRPLDDPLSVIESFILETALYANYGEDESRRLIFSTASQTAEDLASLFV